MPRCRRLCVESVEPVSPVIPNGKVLLLEADPSWRLARSWVAAQGLPAARKGTVRPERWWYAAHTEPGDCSGQGGGLPCAAEELLETTAIANTGFTPSSR